MNLAHRTVPLNRVGHRLEFDYNQGLYRIALYLPEYDPIDGKQTGEKRYSCKHQNLKDALLIVLGEADTQHDPLLVEHYMRSQPWGKELP